MSHIRVEVICRAVIDGELKTLMVKNPPTEAFRRFVIEHIVNQEIVNGFSQEERTLFSKDWSPSKYVLNRKSSAFDNNFTLFYRDNVHLIRHYIQHAPRVATEVSVPAVPSYYTSNLIDSFINHVGVIPVEVVGNNITILSNSYIDKNELIWI